MIGLKCQDTTRERAREDNDQQGVYSHKLHLLENGPKPYGGPQRPDKGSQEEKHDKPEFFYKSDKTAT